MYLRQTLIDIQGFQDPESAEAAASLVDGDNAPYNSTELQVWRCMASTVNSID